MRKLIVAGVVLAVLAGATALAVRMLLSPDMLRRTIEDQAALALDRPVHIGAAKARIFPSPRIQLSNVSIGGPQPLTADEVIVGTGLKPLFQRRVEDALIRVRNGRIVLDAPAAARPPGTPASPPPKSVPHSEGAPDADAGGAATAPSRASGGFTIASVKEIKFENVIVAGGGKELRLDLEGSLRGDALDVHSLSATSGQTELNAKGTLTSIEKLDGHFDLTSPLVDVDEVLAVLAAIVPPDPSARGTSGLGIAEPEGFTFGHLTANAAVEKARALGYQIAKLTTALDLQGTTLKADKLAFEMYGGHYESTLVLDLAANKTTLDHHARLAGANLAQLAALLGHAGVATGTLGLSMQVRGTGRDFATAAEGVSGTANVMLTKGSLKGLDVVRQTFMLLGTAAPPNAGERFDSMSARLALAGGAMSADNFLLHAPDFDLQGKLRVDPAGALSGNAQLTLSDALSKEAQSRNKDLKLLFEEGRITLPAALGGTLQQPRVLPDVQSALKRAAMNKMNTEIDKAKKRGTDELQKGLKRLFGKP